jgi:Na+-transporting methylmalonyl-CoA/oxaloacetate decarboxylase gamma subunit
MEQILSHALERLSHPEVLFGLAVRFFGVFIVLTIVMVILQLVGTVFKRLETGTEETPSPAARARPPGAAATSPDSRVPDEVAVAVALALVPDEVAVAVALALAEAADEHGVAPRLAARAVYPPDRQEPGSAWKLLGRQQALYRKTSLTRGITSKGE